MSRHRWDTHRFTRMQCANVDTECSNRCVTSFPGLPRAGALRRYVSEHRGPSERITAARREGIPYFPASKHAESDPLRGPFHSKHRPVHVAVRCRTARHVAVSAPLPDACIAMDPSSSRDRANGVGSTAGDCHIAGHRVHLVDIRTQARAGVLTIGEHPFLDGPSARNAHQPAPRS